MDECESYVPVTKPYSYPGLIEQTEVKYGYCLATREQEQCNCGGDKSKCDFYKNERKEAKKISTAEMWLQAQEDGNTYKVCDMYYHKNVGFVDENYSPWRRIDATDLLNTCGWEKVETKVTPMTKSEAEAKFNIKIVG